MSQPRLHRSVQLVDVRDPDRGLARAELYRGYPSIELDEVEFQWQAARQFITDRGLDEGILLLEHAHWDWRNKADSVEAGDHMLIAIEVGGEVQGIMAVLGQPRRSRATGSPITYIDYLETAPWNLRLPGASPRFLGVGTVLIGEAIRLSLDCGFDGRIGLHSLPQAEAFYRNRCRMTDFGQDGAYHDLTYFELDVQQAQDWLATTGGIS